MWKVNDIKAGKWVMDIKPLKNLGSDIHFHQQQCNNATISQLRLWALQIEIVIVSRSSKGKSLLISALYLLIQMTSPSKHRCNGIQMEEEVWEGPSFTCLLRGGLKFQGGSFFLLISSGEMGGNLGNERLGGGESCKMTFLSPDKRNN